MFLVLSQFQSDRQSHLQSSCWSRGGGSAGNRWNKIENNIWIVGCDSSPGSANVRPSICMYVTLYVRQYVCMSHFTSVNMYVCHTFWFTMIYMAYMVIKIDPPTWVYKSRSSQLFETCFSCSTLETNESDHIKLWAAVRAICNFLLDLWHSST